MKKIILALFLIFSFVNAEFSVILTDESGKEQKKAAGETLALDIPADQVQQYYDFNATEISSWNSLFFSNTSNSNMLVRFNAGVKTKSQVIYQVGTEGDFFISDYYALSSCEVDKSTNNRPTRSFFIINQGDTKFVMFYLRDCETGELENYDLEPVSLTTNLLALQTNMTDETIDYSGQDGFGAASGLPTVVIAQEATRDFSIKFDRYNDDEFLCKTMDNVKTLELYDGSGNKIENFTYTKPNEKGTKIKFTIDNKKGTNYRKMYFKLTCNKYGVSKQKTQLYYFDARPKEIKIQGLPNANAWLYAEYKYKSDGSSYEDEFSSVIKTEKAKRIESFGYKVVENKLLETKVMNAITLVPVDAKGVEVEDYNSIGEIAITGKIYGDETDAATSNKDENIINEINGDRLTRPCVAGSRDGCAIAMAEINGVTKSEIYTDIVDNQTKVLAYNNVGPTVLYGVDTEWTKYSQSYTVGLSFTGWGPNQESTLCDKFKSHSDEQNVPINGKTYSLVGCNIPFVAENGSDELNFYEFRPAVYSLVFESKNSAQNDSYGIDKLTYMHTIKAEDYDTTNNKIFEAADFNASVLAIGASLDSLEQNRALSHYDNHLKVAKKLTFTNNPANPTITLITAESTQNTAASDFKATVVDDKVDFRDALFVTLQPKNPYNPAEYDTPKLKEASATADLLIDREALSFRAGKSTEYSKLNFKREDLLAKSYIHIGHDGLNVNASDAKNTDLASKITNEQVAFVTKFVGVNLDFIDTAIIAPNVASNETSADAAVYLAGYCEPTSPTNCTEKDVFVSNTIAGHMNYLGFGFNPMVVYEKDVDKTQEESKKKLFDYDGASFKEWKKGADFLGGFDSKEVKVKLQGDQAKEYCEIFRNCYPLSDGTSYGAVFNSFKISENAWHGSGDKQGKTIVDSIANDNKKTRRKEQRLSF